MSAPKATKIVRLSAENYKRLRAVEITPDGNVVRITGKNAAGKSSVLDAIEAALGGKKHAAQKPVRDGEDRARIVAELDGLTITRTFTAEGGGSLVVESADGARYKSPQAILDALVGDLSFDPLAFARLDPKRRLEVVRDVAGVDTSALDGRRARAFEERTDVNRDARRLEGQLAGLGRVDGVPEKPVDVAALAAELEFAQERRADVDKREAYRDRVDDALAGLRADASRLEAELAQVRARIDKGEAELERATLGVAEAITLVPYLSDLRVRLADAERVNAGVRANADRARVARELATALEESRRLTAELEQIDREKEAAIGAAKLPVEGLSWTDDGVTLGGVPFEQASSAEQLRASVALAIASNPTLRVLLVREGSLLDEDGLRLLAEVAAEHDVQVWLEVVSSADGVGVVIEDGSVKGAEPASAGATEQLALEGR